MIRIALAVLCFVGMLGAQDSKWSVSKDTNPLNGAVTVTAINTSGSAAMVLRRTGKNLELYVNTGQFLETIESVETHRVAVNFRIDDAKIETGYWGLSTDYTAVFFRGNIQKMMDRLSHARRFVIQFYPTDKIAQTAVFDVQNIPPEIYSH